MSDILAILFNWEISISRLISSEGKSYKYVKEPSGSQPWSGIFVRITFAFSSIDAVAQLKVTETILFLGTFPITIDVIPGSVCDANMAVLPNVLLPRKFL